MLRRKKKSHQETFVVRLCSAVTVCGTVKIKMHLWAMKAGVMLLDKSIKLICVLTCGFVSFSADVLSGRHHYYWVL